MQTATTTTSTAEIIYVVDDDEAMRDSLACLLEGNGYTVRCHENAERFLQALANTDQSTIACALIDVRMPGMSGLELHKTLSASKVSIPTAFITGHGDVAMAVMAMKQGAVDFIEKPLREDRIDSVVKRMMEKARQHYAQTNKINATKQLLATLTPREKQVLDLIITGRINKEIATELGISLKTVEAHRANVMDKLDVKKATDLLRTILTAHE